MTRSAISAEDPWPAGVPSIGGVLEALRSFVTGQILDGGEDAIVIDPDTPLLEWGILDSLNMMRLLSYLREQLDVDVPADEIVGANFRDLNSIATLVTRLKGE